MGHDIVQLFTSYSIGTTQYDIIFTNIHIIEVCDTTDVYDTFNKT